MPLFRFITPLVVLIACGEKDPTTTDTGSITEEEEEVYYEPGCFVVDGGNGYKYLNDAIAVAEEGSQISPVGCNSFEHEEKIIIDKAVRIVGIGQDRFTLVAPVNETGITITADNVEISDLTVQSTRSGISVEGANNVHLHDMTISEVGNYAIKVANADVQIDTVTMWNNQDGAMSIDGGSVTATELDVRGNVGHSLLVEGGAILTLSDSQVVEAQPTDPTSISDGFGVYLDGGSTLISTNNLYDSNTLMGIQSVNGSIELNNDIVSGSLSTGVWAEGPGSMTLNNVTVDGNLTYGIINMNTGGFTANEVLITVDPTMTPSYDIDTWEDQGFGSMGLFVNSPIVNIDGLEITGYNNCGANFQSDASTEFTVEGLNIHDVGRKGLIIAGFDGEMNNVVIKDIFDLDGNSSKEPDEDGNVADYETFCQLVDRNAGAAIINSDLSVSNVLTENVEGYGWSIIQGNVVLDTALAQNNTCASFLAFQGGLQASNLDIGSNNYEYDGLGAGVAGYSATIFTVDNSIFRANTTELLDISAFLYDSTGTFTNSTFTGGGIAIYGNDSSVDSTSNSFSGQSGYGAFLNLNSSGTQTQSFTNDTFEGTTPTDSSPSVPIYCSDAGEVSVNNSSFTNIESSYALNFSGCNSTVEDSTFTNVSNYTIYGYNGNHDISNSTLNNVNTQASYSSALYFIGTSAMNVSVADVSINNGLGNGIYAYSTVGTTDPIMVDISSVEMTNIGSDAVYLYGAQAFLEDITIDGASQGMNIEESTTSMANISISNASNSGIVGVNSTQTLDTVVLNTSGQYGIHTSGGSLNLSNAQVSNAVDAGLFGENGANITIDSSSFNSNLYGVHLDGTDSLPVTFAINNVTTEVNSFSGIWLNYANGSIDNSTSTNNQEYGMECNESTTTCTANSLVSNLLGEQTGCEATCGVEANPEVVE